MRINDKLLEAVREAKKYWLRDEFKPKFRFLSIVRTVYPSKHYHEVQLKLTLDHY